MEFLDHFKNMHTINAYIEDCDKIAVEHREEYLMAKGVAKEVPHNYFSGKKLIDIGCGPGTSFPIWVNHLGFNHVTAVDGSQEALAILNRRISQGEFSYEVKTHLVELEKEPIPVETESMDATLCAATLFYIRNINNVFQEVSRILKPGGLFAFEACIYEGESCIIQRGPGGCNFYYHPMSHFRSFQKKLPLEFVHALLEHKKSYMDYTLYRYYMLWRKTK